MRPAIGQQLVALESVDALQRAGKRTPERVAGPEFLPQQLLHELRQLDRGLPDHGPWAADRVGDVVLGRRAEEFLDTPAGREGLEPRAEVRAGWARTGTPAAAIAVTPSSHDFGSVVVGQASAAVDLTITNTGIVPTGAFLSTLFTGPGAADYATSLGTCAPLTDIAPGASCTIRVTFTPQATGPRPATLTPHALHGPRTAAQVSRCIVLVHRAGAGQVNCPVAQHDDRAAVRRGEFLGRRIGLGRIVDGVVGGI